VTAINNHGNIVVNTQPPGEEPRIGYYMSHLAAQPTMLPPLQAGDSTRVADINDDQIIVGHSGAFAVAWQAVVDTTGTLVINDPVPLLPLDGDSASQAVGINNPLVGPIEAVGESHAPGPWTAVVWSITLDPDGDLVEPASPVSLGTLGLNSDSGSWSWAHSINSLGDVNGISDQFPFVRPFDGVMQSPDLPRNTQDGTANDINDLGVSVGSLDIHKIRGRQLSGSDPFAYLWQADGTYIDLQTQIDGSSGWGRLLGADQINNAGVIAGRGLYGERDLGFIMTPN
jgi:hypothetical protein